jgi:hypothetical protein
MAGLSEKNFLHPKGPNIFRAPLKFISDKYIE